MSSSWELNDSYLAAFATATRWTQSPGHGGQLLLIIFRPLVTPLLHPRVALTGCGSHEVLRDAISLIHVTGPVQVCVAAKYDDMDFRTVKMLPALAF